MDKNIVVKKSKINKKGVFAARDFSNGEIVLRWNPKILEESKVKELNAEQKHYIYKSGKNKYFLMQPPEKFVNHSCEANTQVKNHCDIAIGDIKKGEEITSNYGKEDTFVSFKCKCGSKKCRGVIN